MSEIKPGMAVIARDVEGEDLPRRALTGVIDGHDFPVVWVCREEEWREAQREQRKPEGVPWPAEDVRLAVQAETAAS